VASISISKRATEKILKERDRQSTFLGKSLVPCLNYYTRSYSTLNDGRIIEHGPGFFLSFIEPSEARDDQYLSIDLGGNCTLVIGPATYLQDGVHSIDWIDWKFTLG
jgi:hypothetical protein